MFEIALLFIHESRFRLFPTQLAYLMFLAQSKIVKPRNVIYEDVFLNHPIKQAFFKKVLLFYISIPVLRISA